MPTSIQELSLLKAVDDPDATVLLQMAEIGADLAKPHRPEFCFEAGTEGQADAIADALQLLGYDVQIYLPDQANACYQVVASTWMVLNLTAVNGLTQTFERLAEQHGAEYDGWGAEIVE